MILLQATRARFSGETHRPELQSAIIIFSLYVNESFKAHDGESFLISFILDSCHVPGRYLR